MTNPSQASVSGRNDPCILKMTVVVWRSMWSSLAAGGLGGARSDRLVVRGDRGEPIAVVGRREAGVVGQQARQIEPAGEELRRVRVPVRAGRTSGGRRARPEHY